MRVIAGRWRGRRLRAPRGDQVRPTTDRVKEALFSILGPTVTETVAVDLCCGAGGLGIEALSRGARRAVFVDQDRVALQAVRANLGTCGAEPASWEIFAGDAVAWLRRWHGPGVGPWILICDPPYPADTAAAIMKIVDSGTLPPGLVAAIVEYGPDTPGSEPLPPGWEQRRYGETHLALRRPAVPEAEQEDRS